MITCCGCGEAIVAFRFVAVMRDDEVGGFVARPVCDPCHQDPAHRKTPLKAHFHPAQRAGVAVAQAGSSDIKAE